METKAQTLHQALERMDGELKALTQMLAAFITASPDRDAFVRDVLPQIAWSLEHARQSGQHSQAYLEGWQEPQKKLTEMLLRREKAQTKYRESDMWE